MATSSKDKSKCRIILSISIIAVLAIHLDSSKEESRRGAKRKAQDLDFNVRDLGSSLHSWTSTYAWFPFGCSLKPTKTSPPPDIPSCLLLGDPQNGGCPSKTKQRAPSKKATHTHTHCKIAPWRVRGLAALPQAPLSLEAEGLPNIGSCSNGDGTHLGVAQY